MKAPKRAGDSRPGHLRPGKRARQGRSESPQPDVPEESDLDQLSEDDVEFVDEYAGRLGFLAGPQIKPTESHLAKGKAKLTEQVKEDERDIGIAAYEEAPRQRLAERHAERQALRLPTKLPDGQLVYTPELEPAKLPKVLARGVTIHEQQVMIEQKSEQATASELESSTNTRQEACRAEEAAEETSLPAAPGLSKAKVTAADRGSIRQQIALAATKLLNAPETHAPSLRYLVQLSASEDDKAAGLAMLSLAAVFRDILPGYRVRLPTDKEKAMSVSKDVRRLRDQEALLLTSYQAYLKTLLKAANSRRKGGDHFAFARVGVRCLCSLLASLHHFNYASDLLQAVVPRMAHHDAGIAAACQAAVRQLLISDAEGRMAREAVQLVADLVRVRKCQCSSEVASVLLSLELADAEIAKGGKPGGKQQAKQSHKTRKPKKRDKGDDVSAAFKEADARASAAERAEVQSQTLEALLEIFFRVLKHCNSSSLLQSGSPGKPSAATAQRKFPLLLPALEGLAKFGHSMSVEYFGDLLSEMQLLLASPGLPLTQRLHTLLTASTLLKGQGEALLIDRRGLFDGLFQTLHPNTLSPLWSSNSHLTGSSLSSSAPAAAAAKAQGAHVQEDSAAAEKLPVLLVQTAAQMLLEQGRALDVARLAAFAKRMCMAAVFVRPAAAMGLLAVTDRLLRRNARLRATLEVEPSTGGPPRTYHMTSQKGDVAQPQSLDAAAAEARNEGLWEVALLKHSPHVHVAAAAASIAASLAEEGGGSPSVVLSSPGGPRAITEAYIAKPHLEHSSPRSKKGGKAATRDTCELSTVKGPEIEQLLRMLYGMGPNAGAQTAFKGGMTAAFVRLSELVA